MMRGRDTDAVRDAVRAVIELYEAALRAAMLTNDVEVLDTLLDDGLIFTGPSGAISYR
ncbi:hypothetical protein BX604_5517 [Burkholderia sp. JKS000303]|nr:hypothetical protein BX604_5517 [Burkholderia sp. JKS000303]